MIPWASLSLQSKRHHDRFSRFGIGESGPQSNTWFPGPTRVLNPNGISIDSAVFAGLTSVTDRPTDHAIRLVTTDCIYIRSMGDVV